MRVIFTAAALVSGAFSTDAFSDGCTNSQMTEAAGAFGMCDAIWDPAERCSCFGNIPKCDGFETVLAIGLEGCDEFAEDAVSEDPVECYGEEIDEFEIQMGEVGICYIETLLDSTTCDAAKACADEVSDPGCVYTDGEDLATKKAQAYATCGEEIGEELAPGIPLCSLEYVTMDLQCDVGHIDEIGYVTDEFCSCIERDDPFPECEFAGEDLAAKYNAFRDECNSTAYDPEAAADPCFYSDTDCWDDGDDYSYYDTQYFNHDPSSAASVTILETMVALAAIVSFL